MSNYTKATNFATKDALSSGNPLKIVKGTEINTEFDAIATAIATKADTASPTFTGTPSLPTGTTGVTQSTGDNSTKLATTAFVQAAATPISSAYPVGSVYINASDSTNPATLLGFGTWTALGEGRVLLGAGSGGGGTYSAGATGGSKDAITVSHTHTYSGTTGTGGGSHSHVQQLYYQGGGGGGGADVNVSGGTSYTSWSTQSTNIDHTHSFSGTTASTGSSATDANLQPYLVVYMWKRTA